MIYFLLQYVDNVNLLYFCRLSTKYAWNWLKHSKKCALLMIIRFKIRLQYNKYSVLYLNYYQVCATKEQGSPSKGLIVKNWSRHEMQMFKTSMWIILFFSFCWIPYGILVLLQDIAPIELKKVSLMIVFLKLNYDKF